MTEVLLCVAKAEPDAPPCGGHGIALVTLGCVHEHIATRVLCLFHLAFLDSAKCGLCLDAGYDREPLHCLNVEHL